VSGGGGGVEVERGGGGSAAALAARIEELKARLPELERERDEYRERCPKLERERDEYRKLYLLAREEIAQLKRGLIGKKAERFGDNDAQLTLSLLGMLLGEEGGEAEKPPARETRVPEHLRRKPVRRQLPADLPRVTVEVTPPEVERLGLDAFEVIGEERREVIERRPASAVVVEVVKKKFVRRAERENAAAGTTEVVVAPTPELPIERGLAGPGFLADTIVKRWQDHLPLHRQEKIYRREGLELSRSTLCGWHEKLAELARAVVEAMRIDARGQPYLCTDATGVLVMAANKCRNGHFWVVVAPGKHVLFEFSQRHDSKAVDELLEGYRGYLVADAHVVYDHLYASGEVIEVNCWAHARRYFFKAFPSDPQRAAEALSKIQKLFYLERAIRGAPAIRRAEVRRQQSAPIVEEFFRWCERQRDLVLDGSPMAEAIRYARNQREGLERFLADQRLPMDNNVSERELRRQAIGRKNWVFVGSADGARTNATFVSLLASCQMHDLEPWAYLRDLFCLLPSWPVHRALELAPAYWRDTIAEPEVAAQLEANVYRRAVLATA
jgi:transposase